jgi:hypothetical protein
MVENVKVFRSEDDSKANTDTHKESRLIQCQSNHDCSSRVRLVARIGAFDHSDDTPSVASFAMVPKVPPSSTKKRNGDVPVRHQQPMSGPTCYNMVALNALVSLVSDFA